MSDPYNNNQYPQGHYGAAQGHPPPHGGYQDSNYQNYQPQQSGYPSQGPTPDPYNQQPQGYGGYGPPAHGGFQHGQSPAPYQGGYQPPSHEYVAPRFACLRLVPTAYRC